MKNKYEFRGEVTAIFIKCNNETIECLIDTNDLEKVNSIKGTWFAVKIRNGGHYIRTETVANKKKYRFSLHRFIMEPEEHLVIDHINHDTIDNRRCNLRAVTITENNQNLNKAKSNSKSGIRGVRYTTNSGNKPWRAYIKLNGKQMNIGYFKTKEEATEAVKSARAKYMTGSQEALAN